MALPKKPITRQETYLSNIAGQATQLPDAPITREEKYLDYIAKNGGGGGTGEGDMKKSAYDADEAVFNAGGIKAFVNSSISGKVDKVEGKGLSSNDYTDSDAAIVAGVTSALDGKVSKSDTAGLLKNDGTVDTNTYAQTSALSGYIEKSNTAGLVKNDGTIDTTTTGAVADNTSAISAIKDGTSMDSFADVEAGFVFDSEHLADTVGYSRDNLFYKKFASETIDGVSLTATESSNNPIIYHVDGAVSQSSYAQFDTVLQPFKAGTYKLVGCPSGGGDDTYSLRVIANTGSTPAPTVATDTGLGASFTLLNDYSICLAIRVKTTGGSSKTFLPMIVREGYTGDYVEGKQPITELLDAKQPKTLDTAITVDGVQKTTVEAALSAINTLAATDKTDIATINGKIPSGASPSNKMATASDVNAKVDWSSYAETGVHNIFDINAPRTNSVGVTSTVTSSATASSLNIKNTTAATYKETDYIGLSFPKNTDLKATFGATVTSGKGRFYIDGSDDGTNWTSIASSDVITASGSFTVPFNTGNYASYRIRWYCSFDVSVAGDITYTNIMISYGTDAITTYAPYAQTNKQLTDNMFPRSEQAVLGAVNFCNPTSTSTGIITRNADNTFTANGTLAEATVYELGRDCFPTLQIGKTYKLVGCPSSGMPNGTNLSIRPVSTSTGGKTESGSGVTWEVTNATTASAFAYLYLAAGTYDNVVFKPMLTLNLDATYDDFMPYSGMTNRELTEKVQSILPDNCKIHRYSYSNDVTPKKFSVGATPLVVIGKHNGGANISVFFVVSNTDAIATIADVGNKFTLTKDANNVFTITSSEAYWSLVFIGDTIPTVTNAS